MTITIAVLGTGRIGRFHAELLHRRVSGIEVGAVYDLDQEAARQVADDLCVDAASTVDEVFANDKIDAVAICSPTPSHVPLLLQAAETDKAVFCEKPIALDLAEIDPVIDAYAGRSTVVQIGFNRRFDAGHRSVHEAVASGEIGAPELVHIISRDPAPPPVSYIASSGGMFLDMTIHDFDMARYITGSDIVSVTARAAVRVDPGIGEQGDVDTAVVVLEHANGAITTIDNSRRAIYGYDQRVEAMGALGIAVSDNVPLHAGYRRTASTTVGPVIPNFFIDRYEAAYVSQWEAFVAAVQSGGPSPVTLADGRAPLVAGLAAIESLKQGRTIECAEIDGCVDDAADHDAGADADNDAAEGGSR